MSQVRSAPYTCDSCQQPIPVCGGVSYGSIESGYRQLCNRCFNEETDFLARGRITWDDEQDGRLPLLVIDGHEITWEQFGRMLMSFEGWQFKLEIHDRSKEI